MRHIRVDKKLEMAVNKALAAALLDDVRAGVKVLINAGVPPHVAARVFVSTKNRRASDWRH